MGAGKYRRTEMGIEQKGVKQRGNWGTLLAKVRAATASVVQNPGRGGVSRGLEGLPCGGCAHLFGSEGDKMGETCKGNHTLREEKGC